LNTVHGWKCYFGGHTRGLHSTAAGALKSICSEPTGVSPWSWTARNDPIAYRRDPWKHQLLQENGYFVWRFLAEDVGRELDRVLDAILRALSRGTSARTPAMPLTVFRRPPELYGNKQTTSCPPACEMALSNVTRRPPCRRARPSRYRSVICLPVVAERTSTTVAGEAASGQKTHSRLAAVSMRIWSAARSGGHGPPGSCAQTRMTPSSLTTHVAQPRNAPSVVNQFSAAR
jgi:hypothetical protein